MRALFDRVVHFNQLRLDTWVRENARRLPAGSKVLDVGAGGAPYRAFFEHCDYCTHDFCQLSPSDIRQGGYAPIDIVSDISSLPVNDAEFDAVVCTEVLEHVPHPIDAINEIGRVLKPGGLLLLSAPLGSGIHQEPFHFYGGYTPFFYRHFLPLAGFAAFSVEPKGGSFSHFAQWMIWFSKAANPFHHSGNLIVRLALLPAYILSLPAVVALYFYARAIDHLDERRQFTGGYFIHATKGDHGKK
jgi:SAM-dependent methyltransferase